MKRLTKKELNKLIETKTMSSIDYTVGVGNKGDHICVNYLDKDWSDTPKYVVGSYGKNGEDDYYHIDSFTNKKHLINYLVNELKIMEVSNE